MLLFLVKVYTDGVSEIEERIGLTLRIAKEWMWIEAYVGGLIVKLSLQLNVTRNA